MCDGRRIRAPCLCPRYGTGARKDPGHGTNHGVWRGIGDRTSSRPVRQGNRDALRTLSNWSSRSQLPRNPSRKAFRELQNCRRVNGIGPRSRDGPCRPSVRQRDRPVLRRNRTCPGSSALLLGGAWERTWRRLYDCPQYDSFRSLALSRMVGNDRPWAALRLPAEAAVNRETRVERGRSSAPFCLCRKPRDLFPDLRDLTRFDCNLTIAP